MVMIQINLDDEEDKIVSIYKIENKLETKEQAIKEIIKKSNKKCNHEFEFVDKIKDGMRQKIIQRCKHCGLIKSDAIYSSSIKTTFSKE